MHASHRTACSAVEEMPALVGNCRLEVVHEHVGLILIVLLHLLKVVLCGRATVDAWVSGSKHTVCQHLQDCLLLPIARHPLSAVLKFPKHVPKLMILWMDICKHSAEKCATLGLRNSRTARGRSADAQTRSGGNHGTSRLTCPRPSGPQLGRG